MNLDGGAGEEDEEYEAGMQTIPPGEEAMFMSHAGGEDELCRSLFEENMATHKRYLGTAPRQPSVAVSFQVLEAYRQYHRVCPRLSIQAHVHALCYLHKVPYWKGFVEQFSHTYDVYLSILHGIDTRVRTVLQQDSADWRMQNACAPCLYTLEGEHRLQHSLLVTMDGNQSLKLVDSAFRAGTPLADPRRARTDFWIPPEVVDQFKDEVGKAKGAGDATLEDVATDESLSPEEAASVCVERWRIAGPEARKKMFALFAVSGVFVCLCRHGHILVMCDMIRSGELMKYPLAIINKLLEVYGPDVLVGYDIGCEFSKTLERSCLGMRAQEKGLKCIVPAFHGHSHNRGCQVQFLPLYFSGAGKEDFEGCERLFSESNALASGTRLATPFHRHQAIEQFATFWSYQKHAESGNFIYDNYKQALGIIASDTEAFNALANTLGVTHDDCERYLREEREYLAKRKSEPPEIAAKIDYVAALIHLEKAGYRKAEITRIRTRSRTTFARYKLAEEEALRMEEDLGLAQRWLPGTAEYTDGVRELCYRKYRCALDHLERLVIQRMFELTKLGMSGIGYKMREKIGKALKSRAEAIRKALEEYNRCASALRPQRPTLSWNDVMEMASLAEFDVLRDAREDVREFPWAQRLHRQAMGFHFNVIRAREEIERLNLEIPRLFTALIDRHVDMKNAIASTQEINPALAHELRLRWEYDDKISARIAARLYETSQLLGFTGVLAAGKRVGQGDGDESSGPQEEGLPGVENEQDAEHLVDFFDRLGVVA
ncbi:hypothetical protein OH76DRAFT_1458094 [Lentinus brumalis]|uniref:CxC1-like cysteine cluster associated with KDZ transposases domain-containing protein n=1 Tax=Lentinus brumalis TaxID=2498619 RepID=A0A371CUZ1_9APHY|nr:hypothetical protein OH76DRAFT_1458094 [Polyporus brumalis]